MPEIQKKMATELQHSLLLQEESFFDFTDAPPSDSLVTLLDNEDDNSLSSHRASPSPYWG